MKEKNGFIFIETIVVLTVTMVSLLTLYNGFILVMKSAENKKYYDNINDVYKAKIVRNMLKEADFILSSGDYAMYTSSNCNSIMESDCSSVINNLKIDYIIFTKNNTNELSQTNANPQIFKNTFKKYLSTLDNDSRYIIVIMIREDNQGKDKRYYAAVKYGDNNA